MAKMKCKSSKNIGLGEHTLSLPKRDTSLLSESFFKIASVQRMVSSAAIGEIIQFNKEQSRAN